MDNTKSTANITSFPRKCSIQPISVMAGKTHISAIERGERYVGDKELVALAEILDVTVEWLIFGDNGDPRAKKQ